MTLQRAAQAHFEAQVQAAANAHASYQLYPQMPNASGPEGGPFISQVYQPCSLALFFFFV